MQDLEQIRNDGYVYVDKTALVYDLVTRGKIYFLSRPRRFGKSLLVSTLNYYFRGKKEVFSGLAIDKLEKEWKEHPVFRMDFNGKNFTSPYELKNTIETFIAKSEEIYGRDSLASTYGDRLLYVFQKAHEQTGQRVVVLIDEYDKPLLDVMESDIPSPEISGEIKTLEDYNREILKGFYSVFKLADEHLRFVLLTGVTKFSQISVFSGFNQPKDISLDRRYEALCGITKEELTTIFRQPIEEMAAAHSLSYNEMTDKLTRKYDGYHFSSGMLDIFNPFSILNCFATKELRNFWFASGTPAYLVKLLQHSGENINELAGKYYDESDFVNNNAYEDRPLPMIYQSGYLTIKDYDREMGVFLLDFPNDEVRQGFIDVLSSDYFNSRTAPKTWVVEVTRGLRGGDIEGFVKKMRALLASVTYRFQRKQIPMECERHFQYTFYLILQLIGHYNTMVEKETSEGCIDCVVECPDYVYILEFKMDGSAKEAVTQIHNKGYAKPYSDDNRQIFLVGINFSSQTGTIEEYQIEKY